MPTSALHDQDMNQRVALPTDLTDLSLAPVALALSRRLARLGTLASLDLVRAIALSTDHDPVPGRRGDLLIEMLDRDLDLHDWGLAWCPSGLRMSHNEHELVLGITPSLRDFLSEDEA
jgi:hypothetical protein